MLVFAGSGCDFLVCNSARTLPSRELKTCFQLLNRGSLSVRRDFHRRFQVPIVLVIGSVRLLRLEGNGLHCREIRKHLMKLPTFGLRHGVVRMHGRTSSLGWFFELGFSAL